MRKEAKYILAILALAIPVYSQFTKASLSDDTQEIRGALTEIEESFVSRAPEPFERIYLDGYVSIRGRPVYNAKEQLAAMVRWDAAAIKSGKKLDFETLSYESEQPQVRLFGDAAVVTAMKKNLWRYKDQRCLTQYQSTELWIKVTGTWKLAAGHMTTIQCEPLPWQPLHPAVAAVRSETSPTKFVSASAETDLRELIVNLDSAGIRSDNNVDAFAEHYVSTSANGDISTDRSSIIEAFRIPTSRSGGRYKDDETFLNFGPAAMYIFRVRTLAKAGSGPTLPQVVSVIFIKQGSVWKIAASHISTIQD